MKQLKKIWADPVWSKVISAIIIAIGAVFWTLISTKIDDVDFQTAWINLWTFNIKLWWLTVGIIIFLLLFWLRQFFKKSIFKYDDETIKLDRQIFEKIRTELLPQTGAIYFLRHNNFAGFSFNTDSIEDLDNFEHECNKSDFEFLNPDLERMKIELLNSVDHFTGQIAVQTFPTNNGRQTVPPEWEIEQPERFWEVVNDLHRTKFQICDKYDELIKLGRRVLKI
ncbi:hypothetical protein [Larkinella punicea]|uniref:Uncharacterized protein n=1 Tax=Larkinella punicea TaxID=2315727 RepID=A0A368JTR4_9BACT|nr:hypothetical protein [Larkinella punicea]RCR70725.1 hypothetical protein DUE52_03795 [Larkinella punicea]